MLDIAAQGDIMLEIDIPKIWLYKIKGAKMNTCIFSVEPNNSMRLMLKYIVIKRENFDRFRFWANNDGKKIWFDC